MFSRKTDDETETPQREVENLIGWRKMKILPVGLLVSPLREGGMTSILSEEAVCDKDPKHDAPEGDCSPGCGWYAFYKADSIYGGMWKRWEEQFKSDDAIVEVSAVGKTWLHDKGFRTKQIRMESIWVPKGTDAGLVETLTEMYALPVYEIPGREEPTEEDDPPAAGAPVFDKAKIAWTEDPIWSKRLIYKDSPPMSKDDFINQYLGGFDPWKLEREKSSLPPSPPSEPLGKSPLTSARELTQKDREELDSLLSGRPSQFADKRVRDQAEHDLARARAELSQALGKCALCNKTGIHEHDINDLKGESGG